MSYFFFGPTDLFLEAFGVQYNEHVIAWRWHCFVNWIPYTSPDRNYAHRVGWRR